MPTISLVTPSLGQAEFLEDALSSVLDQGYPELEYVVADGGSKDGSVEIIERHAERLHAWWSESDAGHANALNRAFARTSGSVMGWLNADDRLFPGTLALVGRIFGRFPHVHWLTSGFPALLNADGDCVFVGRNWGFHRTPFLLGMYGDLLPTSRFFFIQQESTFWRRSLWETAGGHLDESTEPAADFELWSRFFEHAELYTLDALIGGFRAHPAQRTAAQKDEYRQAALRVLARHEKPSGRSNLAARAATVLPGRAARALRLGWEVPCIRWSRQAQEWVEARRFAA